MILYKTNNISIIIITQFGRLLLLLLETHFFLRGSFWPLLSRRAVPGAVRKSRRWRPVILCSGQTCLRSRDPRHPLKLRIRCCYRRFPYQRLCNSVLSVWIAKIKRIYLLHQNTRLCFGKLYLHKLRIFIRGQILLL